MIEEIPPPLPPPGESKPWWESSGFRSLVATLYGIWLIPLYKYVESKWGGEYAGYVTGTVTAVLSAFGFVKVAQQSEARGRAQEKSKPAP